MITTDIKPKRGRPLKSHCLRGHDMSITRKRCGTNRTGRYYCTACAKAGEFPSWRPSRKADYGLQRSYGITLEQKNAILAAQGSVCAICGTSEFGKKGPQVDHCHNAGGVRGVLCQPCNTAIGLFREDPAIMAAASRYLTSKMETPAA